MTVAAKKRQRLRFLRVGEYFTDSWDRVFLVTDVGYHMVEVLDQDGKRWAWPHNTKVTPHELPTEY